jgi:hypothetical protein
MTGALASGLLVEHGCRPEPGVGRYANGALTVASVLAVNGWKLIAAVMLLTITLLCYLYMTAETSESVTEEPAAPAPAHWQRI